MVIETTRNAQRAAMLSNRAQQSWDREKDLSGRIGVHVAELRAWAPTAPCLDKPGAVSILFLPGDTEESHLTRSDLPLPELLRQLVMTAPEAQARLDQNAGAPTSPGTANAIETLLTAGLRERFWRLGTLEISVAFESRSFEQTSLRAGLPPMPVAGTRLLGPSYELLYGRSANSRQHLSISVSQPPLPEQHPTKE